jgi:hypothetical protein
MQLNITAEWEKSNSGTQEGGRVEKRFFLEGQCESCKVILEKVIKLLKLNIEKVTLFMT